MKTLEGKQDYLIQTERTRRGVCARCGEASQKHADGNCADGAGTFTWSYTPRGMAVLRQNLEKLVGRKS